MLAQETLKILAVTAVSHQAAFFHLRCIDPAFAESDLFRTGHLDTLTVLNR